MKITKHEDMRIENFGDWFNTIHKQHPEILGAEWDSQNKVLKIFYQDGATELSKETLQNLKIPTVLTFRKKVTPPKLDSAAAVVSATENEFTVETFDVENTRKEAKQKLPDFEEVKT
jgi:hypothetical protein